MACSYTEYASSRLPWKFQPPNEKKHASSICTITYLKHLTRRCSILACLIIASRRPGEISVCTSWYEARALAISWFCSLNRAANKWISGRLCWSFWKYINIYAYKSIFIDNFLKQSFTSVHYRQQNLKTNWIPAV